MRIPCSRLATLFALVCGLLLSAHAAWYWPFDFDPDSTNRPPRLHRLLEKANEYIELAEDEALEGNGEKAIANYRLALKELDRVEEENPDRAESPEFAPLRTKRATCSAAIDTIRFAQVNENERAVSVSNTTNLERKWRIKHGLQTKADEEFVRREAAKGKEGETVEGRQGEERNQASANPSTPRSATPEPQRSESEAPREKAEDARVQKALAAIRAGDYLVADRLLEEVMSDRPKDLNPMLLRAAAQVGAGSLFAARRTLEKAMREHPKSYLPCYNLANLMLRLGESVESARECYERGRSLGGPRNEALEKKVNQQ